MKCIVFDMPPMLVDQLALKDCEPFMHQYLVTENGDVMVPWYDFIDEDNSDDNLRCTVLNDTEFYSAADLVKFGLEEYKDTLKVMLGIMLRFHNSRFDQSEDRAEG